MLRSVVDSVVHPRCQSEARSPRTMVLSVAAFLLLFVVVAFLLWPSYWLVPIAVFIGICIAVHPLCLILDYQHKPGRRWR